MNEQISSNSVNCHSIFSGFDLLCKGQKTDFSYLGRRVTGATLGIVGMGRIGYKVAERALGFRMKVFYHNRNRR